MLCSTLWKVKAIPPPTMMSEALSIRFSKADIITDTLDLQHSYIIELWRSKVEYLSFMFILKSQTANIHIFNILAPVDMHMFITNTKHQRVPLTVHCVGKVFMCYYPFDCIYLESPGSLSSWDVFCLNFAALIDFFDIVFHMSSSLWFVIRTKCD